MTSLAREAARLVDSLPREKARALIEYARYLADKAGEEEWDRQFSEPKYRRKFRALVAQVERDIAAGKTEPLDLDRL